MLQRVERLGLSGRTDAAVRQTLAGQRHGARAMWSLVGPAVIASVAYMDPGNYATNIQAGASYNYGLLWVVVLANVVAMLFQGLSARIGIVTGRNLAELCRLHLPRWMIYPMWVVSEIAAMATDLAEFTGGAIGIALLLGIPLMAGMAIAAVVTYAVLTLQRHGFRGIEIAITAMVAVISISYLIELIIAPPDWGQVALHAVLPELADSGALTLAVGIVGATVMPHAIFLHSALTQDRVPVATDGDRAKLIRYSNREVVVALSVAGLVNMAMVAMAATVFYTSNHRDITDIGEAYQTLVPLLGAGAAVAFLVSLVASGLSSSVVGTMAGQVVMQGFVRFHIPIWLRRALTMLPAFIVVGVGVNPTSALVYSQIVLSMALPVPMVALVWLVRRPDIMGRFAIGRTTLIGSVVASVLVLTLNAMLMLQSLGASVPGLS